MNYLDLLLMTSILGAGLAANHEALANPPAELIENLDMLDDLPLLQDEEPR